MELAGVYTGAGWKGLFNYFTKVSVLCNFKHQLEFNKTPKREIRRALPLDTQTTRTPSGLSTSVAAHLPPTRQLHRERLVG